MLLVEAELKTEYIVVEVVSEDEELNSFLFTLGCYKGEKITVVSKNSSGFVLVIKDGRYSIDEELANAIVVEKVWKDM